MKRDLLMDALKRRKGKSFNSKEFLQEKDSMPEKESKSGAGLDSEDLHAKESVVVGKGVDDEQLKSSNYSSGKSTDDLSPSDKELEARQVRTKKDSEVFDESEYKRIKRKKKPSGLFERVQMSLGDKLNN